MAEQVRHTVKGRTFVYTLPPADPSRIKYFFDKRMSARTKFQKAHNHSATVIQITTLAAKSDERNERIVKAYKALEKAGKLYEYEVTPQQQVINGPMKKGEAGISQRSDEDKTRDKHVNKDLYTTLNSEQAVLNEKRAKRNRVDHVVPKPVSSDSMFDYLSNLTYVTSGAGEIGHQFAEFFSKIDRFNNNMLPRNAEFPGYTFITRPRLNLTSANIIADRNFAPLNTASVNSVPFMIRCLLDTQFCKDEYDMASRCQLLDYFSPFNTLLGNALLGISGFPDPSVYTETTEGGFFSEDQTYVIGADRLAKTYDFSLQFKDVQGGPVLATIDYWCRYMANIMDGTFIQYPGAIDRNRLDYTVSIYRFITDRSKRFITKWAKLTGSFPKVSPSGTVFNKNQGEYFITASGEFTVPFVVNHIGLNDPIILKEFNMLVDRYAGPVLTDNVFNPRAINNFKGLPYIYANQANGLEMVFRALDVSKERLVSIDKFSDYISSSTMPSGRENSRIYGNRDSQAIHAKSTAEFENRF